jgi:hypothetical protein
MGAPSSWRLPLPWWEWRFGVEISFRMARDVVRGLFVSPTIVNSHPEFECPNSRGFRPQLRA